MASHAQLSVQERLDEDKQIAADEALAGTLQGQLLDATGYTWQPFQSGQLLMNPQGMV